MNTHSESLDKGKVIEDQLQQEDEDPEANGMRVLTRHTAVF